MNIKKIIREFIERELGLSEVIEKINQIVDNDFADQMLLQMKCQQWFSEPQFGSSRMVCDFDDELTIKIAKKNCSGKGEFQNKMEFETSSKNRNNPLFTRVYYHHPEFKWIVSERVEPANKTDFENIYGVKFDDFSSQNIYNPAQEGDYDVDDRICKADIEKYIVPKDESYLSQYSFADFLNICEAIRDKRKDYDMEDDEIYHAFLRKHKFFQQVGDLIIKTKILVGDVKRIVNWGIAQRNGEACFVLLDFGLDNKSFKKLY